VSVHAAIAVTHSRHVRRADEEPTGEEIDKGEREREGGRNEQIEKEREKSDTRACT